MPETTPTKTPLSLPEMAPRAATYGALFTSIIGLLGVITYLHNGLEGRTARFENGLSDLRREVIELRKDTNNIRVEFAEFRAELRAEVKALHLENADLKQAIADVATLIKERR